MVAFKRSPAHGLRLGVVNLMITTSATTRRRLCQRDPGQQHQIAPEGLSNSHRPNPESQSLTPVAGIKAATTSNFKVLGSPRCSSNDPGCLPRRPGLTKHGSLESVAGQVKRLRDQDNITFHPASVIGSPASMLQVRVVRDRFDGSDRCPG